LNLLLLRQDECTIPSSDQRFQHIVRVLRLSVGDTLKAGIIDGPVGIAVITAMSHDSIELEFNPEHEPEQPADITILLGHPRPIVLRRLFRDLASIGVARLDVVHTELGEKSYFRASLWDDIETPLAEGAAIGGSTLLPAVRRFHTLRDALRSIDPTDLRLVPHLHTHSSHPARVSLVAALVARPPCRAVIAVGSERGWSADELTLLFREGFTGVSLGSHILRTESAAIIAAWTLCSWIRGWGDGSA
jgi:16S rRNA (uracil1498-N3)-methyltransferase